MRWEKCLTWNGRVCEFAKQNNLDVDGYYTKLEIKLAMAEAFKMHWHSNLNEVAHNPILRTYTNSKAEFGMEPHLSVLTNYKYRDAITKLPVRAHTQTPKPRLRIDFVRCVVLSKPNWIS